jgi:adenylate cyclase
MKWILSPLWAIVTTVLLAGVILLNPSFIQNIELKFFDQLIVQDQISVDDIVLIDISENTLEKHGQYPFPRNVYGELIQKLRMSNAGVIVFNISFPEEDRTGQDTLFKELLNQDVVISHFPSTQTDKGAAYTTGIVEVGNRANQYVPNYPGIAANIEEYERRASGIGIASTVPEIDGVVRRIPMISAVDETLYPSIVLEILKVYMNTETYQVKTGDLGVEAVRVKGFPTINTDTLSRIWINPNYKFQRYNLDDEIPDLKGATVFVGLTAEGLSNPVPTATGPVYGHDITASAFASVVDEYNIVTPLEADLYKLGSIILIGLLIIVTSYMRFGWIAPILLISAAIYYPFYAFATSYILVNTAISGVLSVLIFAHVYGLKYGQEYFAKMQIKKQFGGYASPEVVEILQKNPKLVKEGIKKEVSICFSDLRGFTPLGESFGDDVKGLTEVMNGYMDAITQPVLDAKGMIIKYIGDASMHIHNAPIDDPDHPKSAVQTGLNMIKAVEKFNEQLIAKGRPKVGMGAGINTGLGYIGEMGSTKRHSYDVLGDAVSTTARLEGQCKAYGVLLIIGPTTYELTKDDFFYLELDELAVKGKTVGLHIYTVLDDPKPTWAKSKKKHDEMLKLYRNKEFDKAQKSCELLATHFDGKMEGYYEMWIERCEFMKTQQLPENWDGIFRATTK